MTPDQRNHYRGLLTSAHKHGATEVALLVDAPITAGQRVQIFPGMFGFASGETLPAGCDEGGTVVRVPVDHFAAWLNAND